MAKLIYVEYLDTAESALLYVSEDFHLDDDTQEPFEGVCADTGETLRVARPWDCEISLETIP